MTDWSAHDRFSENTIECSCGEVFRSHSKWSAKFGIETRKPCPSCHQTSGMRRASSDVETFEYYGRSE
jgi:hypothetical protein